MSEPTLSQLSAMLDRTGVAELLGVSPSTVTQYRTVKYRDKGEHSFPEPAGKIGRSPYWTRESIENWAGNRVGPGRPRKNPDTP